MTLYASSPFTGLPAATKTWLDTLKANFSNTLTFTIPNTGDRIDQATGNLTGSWTDTGGGTVTGTNTGAFQVGSGFRIKWTTGGIVGGRRVRGTTFMVPSAGLCFDVNGRLGAATVSAVTTATNTFLTTMGSSLVIWSRPTASRAGQASPVTGFSVPTSATQLRSRRV